MSGLNRIVMVSGMMAALAMPSLGSAVGIKSRMADPIPLPSYGGYNRPRGKGRNKSPRRFSGVAAAKRAAVKARNRRKS